MAKQADAYPRKRFFLEMFTRDISLEECLLDLIDNAVDAFLAGIDHRHSRITPQRESSSQRQKTKDNPEGYGQADCYRG